MVLAAVLCGCRVPHMWHLRWLVGVGTLPLQAERRHRMQEELPLCSCVPAAFFAPWAERGGCLQHHWVQSSYPSLLSLHTFSAKRSHQLSTLSAARGVGHRGAAVLQGTSGTSGLGCWAWIWLSVGCRLLLLGISF